MAAVSERILYAKIKESLSEEFEENGFEVVELYSYVAGKAFASESTEIAIVAKKS